MEEKKSFIHWKALADYEKREFILDAIRQNKHCTQLELSIKLGVDPKTFRKHIRGLVEHGTVIEKRMGPVLTYFIR